MKDLIFIAYVIRLDIICAAEQLSQFLNNPSFKYMLIVKWVLHYLKGIFRFNIIYHSSLMHFIDYSNANWVEDIDNCHFIIEYIVMINNEIIAWRSQFQFTIILSTMEAEYMTLTNATKKLIWIHNLFIELSYINDNTKSSSANILTQLYFDNQRVIAFAKNSISHIWVKYIDIHHHFIWEIIQDKIIWV